MTDTRILEDPRRWVKQKTQKTRLPALGSLEEPFSLRRGLLQDADNLRRHDRGDDHENSFVHMNRVVQADEEAQYDTREDMKVEQFIKFHSRITSLC